MNGYINYIRRVGYSDGYIYCAPMQENAIYAINYENGCSKKILDLPYDGTNILKDIYLYDDLIICVSSKGMRIFIYDKKNGKEEFYEGGYEDTLWQNTCLNDGEIWFLPRDLKNDICIFSLKYKEFKKQKYASEALHKIQTHGIARRIFHSRDELFFILTDEKIIIRYSIKDNQANILDIPQDFAYYDMTQCGGNYYFVVRNGGKKLLKWDIDKKRMLVINGRGEGNYVRLIKMGDDSILLSSDSACDGEELLNCDSIYQTGVSDMKGNVSKGYRHYSLLTLEHGYLALPWCDDYFVIFDDGYKYRQKKRISIPSKDYFEKRIVEEGAYGLADFIGYICSEA